MSHFVLEIGTEELPSRFLAPLEKELSDRVSAMLGEADLSFDEMDVCATPGVHCCIYAVWPICSLFVRNLCLALR